MPNKARLDKEAREIVWRVSEYFRKQLNSNTADYVEKTVSACGVSRATVYRIRKEKEEPNAGKNRNKKPVTVYDEERYLIRKALYEFQQEEGCPPTLEQLRVRLQSTMDFDGDERMLRKMLRRQGFFLKKIDQTPPVKQEPESSAEEQNQDIEESVEQEMINNEEEDEVMQIEEEERVSQTAGQVATVQQEQRNEQPITQVKPSQPQSPKVQTVTVTRTKLQIEREPHKIQVTPIARLTQAGLVAQKVLVNQRAIGNQNTVVNQSTVVNQKVGENQKTVGKQNAIVNRKTLINQKALVNSSSLVNQKALMNPKAQMYQIVGVGKGGQVILKPQGQQVRLVQKGTTILKVNQQRLQQQG